MSGKQHKRAEKARRQAEREAAKAAERRRNQITALIVVGIIALGGVLIAVTVAGDGDDVVLDDPDASEDDADATDDATEIEPLTPTEVVPDDPEIPAGEPVDSEREPVVDERDVACDADEPDGLNTVRPMYPGGPSDVLEEGVDYTAVIETSCGTVTMDLLEDDAPLTVNSFVFLAQEGFFDGVEIFRNATTIGALQTGGGDNSNTWGIGYSLPDELDLAQTEGYPVGSVAMANSGPNTGGSQFFFVYNELFDQSFAGAETFAVFGQVTEGLDVLEEMGTLGTVETDPERPEERIYIESVTIEEG